MEQTKTMYYWIIDHQDELERIGERYRLTKTQLEEFYTLASELLDLRSIEEARQLLPPYPAGEIDEEYWEDLERSAAILSDLLHQMEGMPETTSFYYVGTLPIDNASENVNMQVGEN